jgi:hypothetical protein
MSQDIMSTTRQTRMHRHACTLTRVHAYTPAELARTHTRTRAHTHTHTRTHARTHTHAHTHTRTHAYMHTCIHAHTTAQHAYLLLHAHRVLVPVTGNSTPAGWSVLPVFERGGPFVASGAYHLPLFKGVPSWHLIQASPVVLCFLLQRCFCSKACLCGT